MLTRAFLKNFAQLLILCEVVQAGVLGGPLAWAEPITMAVAPISPEPVPVGPEKPTPPPAIMQPKVTDGFHCARKFSYLGKTYDCDSNVGRDAERLRPLMTDEPTALAEIDSYQRNRQSVRKFAYIGSVGLVAAIGGELLSRTFTDANGNTTATGTEIRNYGFIGGAGLALISFGISLATLSKGNNYIKDAVNVHNQAHPNEPITLIDF